MEVAAPSDIILVDHHEQANRRTQERQEERHLRGSYAEGSHAGRSGLSTRRSSRAQGRRAHNRKKRALKGGTPPDKAQLMIGLHVSMQTQSLETIVSGTSKAGTPYGGQATSVRQL